MTFLSVTTGRGCDLSSTRRDSAINTSLLRQLSWEVSRWRGTEFTAFIALTHAPVQSEKYLALNPQGKMPLLVWPDGSSLPESEVIVQYLLDKHKDSEYGQLL